MTAVFIRLLAEEDKGAALEGAVQGLRAGDPDNGLVYRVEPAAFGEIPGSPFAYWASERVRRLFRELPPFESQGRIARRGPSTGDDFRRLRTWWEVQPSLIGQARRWVPFAKGGSFAPYYADIGLVVAWDEARHTFFDFWGRPGRMIERPESVDQFFRPGLTWPLRTSGLSFRAMPLGGIFGHKGPALLVAEDEPRLLESICAVANSSVVLTLIQLVVARVSLAQAFEVGLLKLLPFPSLRPANVDELSRRVRDLWALAYTVDLANETSHAFVATALAIPSGVGLSERIQSVAAQQAARLEKWVDLRSELDCEVRNLYGLGENLGEIGLGGETDSEAVVGDAADDVDEADQDDGGAVSSSADGRDLVADFASYALGCAFGRWDVRLATGERDAPPLPDPFAPLPPCSPGMLTGADGLPLSDPPPGYPLAIARDGILVDDPDHADDIVARVRAVLDLLWGDRAAAIEREACELLGVKELREYFRNPRLFFDDHIKRYSRSRRKAPIYWLLQSNKRSYGLWLYLHRLDADTLFKALERYVGRKLALETQRANDLRAVTASMPQGPNRRQRERDLERQEALVSEIADFKSELERVARLGLTPNLDDGVVLTIAPLHELVPWKEAERYWKELIAGKYAWASIAKQLRSKGLVQ